MKKISAVMLSLMFVAAVLFVGCEKKPEPKAVAPQAPAVTPPPAPTPAPPVTPPAPAPKPTKPEPYKKK